MTAVLVSKYNQNRINISRRVFCWCFWLSQSPVNYLPRQHFGAPQARLNIPIQPSYALTLVKTVVYVDNSLDFAFVSHFLKFFGMSGPGISRH